MRDRLLPLGAALAAFGLSLGSGFHSDDYGIFRDPLLSAEGRWKTLWAWTRTRPLTDLTYWLNYQLGGNDALGYHAVNLALHLAAVWLVFECLRRVLPERAALIAAIIFAAHPMQSQVVDSVAGRGAALAAVLCLAAWWAWMEGQRAAAAACFAAALLAQPECAAFPALLLLFRGPNEEMRRRWLPLGIMLTLAVAAVAHALAARPESTLPAGRYFLTGGAAISRYLRLMVIPYGFTADPDVGAPGAAWGLLAWAAVLALGWGAWKMRWRWLLAGLILLVPSAAFFPAPDPAADWRMYLPMVAFAAGAGRVMAGLKAPAATIAAVTAGLALVILSVDRTRVWNDDQALWREAVERAPNQVRPKIELARTLPAGQALEVLAAARRQAPQDPRVAAEVGRVLLSQGQADAAVEEFSHAVAADPRDALSLNNRGVAFEMLGQAAAARADFEHALQIDPGLAQARENLAKLTGAR